MAATNKKTEGPTCACGKVDLYEDWLKQNEKKENTSAPTSQTDDQISSADSAGKGDTTPLTSKN